jgi:hypothetical protein
MSYQNLWGLRPKDPPDDRRIIGGSVLFPLQESRVEAPELLSLVARSRLVFAHLD